MMPEIQFFGKFKVENRNQWEDKFSTLLMHLQGFVRWWRHKCIQDNRARNPAETWNANNFLYSLVTWRLLFDAPILCNKTLKRQREAQCAKLIRRHTPRPLMVSIPLFFHVDKLQHMDTAKKGTKNLNFSFRSSLKVKNSFWRTLEVDITRNGGPNYEKML